MTNLALLTHLNGHEFTRRTWGSKTEVIFMIAKTCYPPRCPILEMENRFLFAMGGEGGCRREAGVVMKGKPHEGSLR